MVWIKCGQSHGFDAGLLLQSSEVGTRWNEVGTKDRRIARNSVWPNIEAQFGMFLLFEMLHTFSRIISKFAVGFSRSTACLQIHMFY